MRKEIARITPADFTEIKRDDALGVLVVASADRLKVMAFKGRKKRHDFYFRFPTQERAEQYVADWLREIEEQAARARARREQPHPLTVGQVLVSSWGYDQTNIDYYEVVGLAGAHFVLIRPIRAEVKGYCGQAMSGLCVPVPGDYQGEAIRRRASAEGAVKLDSFRYAHPRAEGRESERFTTYA